MVGDEIVKEIVLVGFGGHAKSVIDSIEGMKAYKIAGYVDCADMPDYKGYTRIGNDAELEKLYAGGDPRCGIDDWFYGEVKAQKPALRIYEKNRIPLSSNCRPVGNNSIGCSDTGRNLYRKESGYKR